MDDYPATADDARRIWAPFYGNEAIRALGSYPSWSVSDPKDKRPLDVSALTRGELFGASPRHPGSTVTLDELVETFPNLVNNALSLDAARMGYAVLDIEKTASAATRERMLALPWVYAETSMSGKGIHLVIPYPQKLMERYPYATAKPAVKAPDGTWELLLSHWVTFTRNVIDARPGTADIAPVLEPILATVRPPAPPVELKDLPKIEDVPDGRLIMRYLASERFPKTPECYEGDLSRLDFSGLVYYLARIRRFCALNSERYALTDEDQVTLAIQMLADDGWERDKWYGKTIHGTPYIIYSAKQALARVKDNERNPRSRDGRRKG